MWWLPVNLRLLWRKTRWAKKILPPISSERTLRRKENDKRVRAIIWSRSKPS